MSSIDDANALLVQAEQKRDEAISNLLKCKEIVEQFQAELAEAAGYGKLGDAHAAASAAGVDSGDIGDALNQIGEAVREAAALCGNAISAADTKIEHLKAKDFTPLS